MYVIIYLNKILRGESFGNRKKIASIYFYLRVFGILNITHNSGRETRGQLSISRIAPPLRGSEPLLLFVGG